VINIKIPLREIGFGGMDWIDLAQDKDVWKVLVNTGINSGDFLSGLKTRDVSRRAQICAVA
jgi:hypothetical protein